jgi:hypothetical protein
MYKEEDVFLLQKFDEGCELTDAVQLTLNAAYCLMGIGEYYKANILIATAEQCINDYYQWVVDQGTREDFDKVDADLWYKFRGGPKESYNFNRL